MEGEYIDQIVPTGREVTPEYLKKAILSFIEQLPFKPTGIGMGVVGLVEDNTLKISHLKKFMRDEGGFFSTDQYNMHFINDVKAAMLCEEQFYDKNTPFALIMAGSGFAMSVRTEGVQVLGRNGWAGELGSNPYVIDGNVKTLDKISGGNAILAKAGCNIEELVKAIDNRETFATDIIEEAGFYFGLALCDVIHTFSPEYIVVGGGCTKFKGYMETAEAVAKQHTLEGMFSSCKIVKPQDAKRIVALGAKRLAEIRG